MFYDYYYYYYAVLDIIKISQTNNIMPHALWPLQFLPIPSLIRVTFQQMKKLTLHWKSINSDLDGPISLFQINNLNCSRLFPASNNYESEPMRNHFENGWPIEFLEFDGHFFRSWDFSLSSWTMIRTDLKAFLNFEFNHKITVKIHWIWSIYTSHS